MPEVTPIWKQSKRSKPKWRKPLPVKSAKRYSENEYREQIRQQVFARDGAQVPRLLPAARLRLAEGPEITALARNRAGWARLCRLLTTSQSG